LVGELTGPTAERIAQQMTRLEPGDEQPGAAASPTGGS
jgi:hypothetical protein